MKKFKNLHLPLMDSYIEAVQQAHCECSMNCTTGDCEECLFCSANLEAFTQWYFDGAYRNHENKDNEQTPQN